MLKIAPAKPLAKPTPADAPTADPPVDDAVPDPAEVTAGPADIGEGPPDAAPSGAKVPQPLVLYMTSDLGPFQCDHCHYFAGPASCAIVDGDIDPAGKCNLFIPADTQAAPDGGNEMPPPDDSAMPPAKGPMNG